MARKIKKSLAAKRGSSDSTSYFLVKSVLQAQSFRKQVSVIIRHHDGLIIASPAVERTKEIVPNLIFQSIGELHLFVSRKELAKRNRKRFPQSAKWRGEIEMRHQILMDHRKRDLLIRSVRAHPECRLKALEELEQESLALLLSSEEEACSSLSSKWSWLGARDIDFRWSKY